MGHAKLRCLIVILSLTGCGEHLGLGQELRELLRLHAVLEKRQREYFAEHGAYGGRVELLMPHSYQSGYCLEAAATGNRYWMSLRPDKTSRLGKDLSLSLYWDESGKIRTNYGPADASSKILSERQIQQFGPAGK